MSNVPNFFWDRDWVPFVIPISSSGVQIVGGSTLEFLQIFSIRLRVAAFAVCLKFQVSKYYTPFLEVAATSKATLGSVSGMAFIRMSSAAAEINLSQCPTTDCASPDTIPSVDANNVRIDSGCTWSAKKVASLRLNHTTFRLLSQPP